MTLDMYQERIMAHYERPYHFGELETPALDGHRHNPLCGDAVRIQASLDAEERITEAYFQGVGCVISLAAASILMEAVEGKSMAEIKAMTRQDMLDLLGIRLTAMRVKCAMLPLHTFVKAIHDYEAEAST